MAKGRYGQGSIRKRTQGGWAIRYSRAGQPFHESVASVLREMGIIKTAAQTTEQDARRALRHRLGELHAGHFITPAAKRMTIAELLDAYVADRTLSGKSSADIKSAAETLKATIGYRRVGDVNLYLLQHYATQMLADGFARGTVKVRLAYLRAAFVRGRRAGLVTHVPDFPELHVDNARQGFFEPGDVAAVCRRLSLVLADVVMFGYWSGWRRREITGLLWADVDQVNGVIALPGARTKTGKARTLPIAGEIARVIADRFKARALGCAHVFHRRGVPIKDFDRAWQRALEDAGLAGKMFHDLRRTVVRDQENAGIPRSVGKRTTGHVSDSVYERYAIQSVREQATAMTTLAAYRAQHMDTGGSNVDSHVAQPRALKG